MSQEENIPQEQSMSQEENIPQEQSMSQEENIPQEQSISEEESTTEASTTRKEENGTKELITRQEEIMLPQTKMLNTNQIQTGLLAKGQIPSFDRMQGFFIIHIVGDGKESIRKIDVNLSTLDRSRSQTIYFRETDLYGSSDNHNFQILTTSAKTKPTEQNSYAVFTFEFSYTKPAHYKAKHSYFEKTGNERFNFNQSPTDTTTTINNTGHNVTDVTENIKMQINLANCGISSDGVTFSNAIGLIELYKGYYAGLNIDPNGGVHDGKNYKYNYGVECCDTEVIINNPTREGYVFIGWTFSKGSNCGAATFNDSTFKYCGESKSSSNSGDDNTCTLKAEWIINNENYVLPEAGAKNLSYITSVGRNSNNINSYNSATYK